MAGVLLAIAAVVPVVVADQPSAAGGAATLDYPIKVEAVYKEFSDQFFWFHPYLAAVPRSGRDGRPAVLMLTQKHLVARILWSRPNLA